MIETLFRGKRLDTGEWITSHSILKLGEWEYPGKEVYMLEENGSLLTHYTDNGGLNTRRLDGTLLRIEPETVGQFTGQRDKKGNRIFEGDLVRNGNDVYKVCYNEKYGRFAYTKPNVIFAGFCLRDSEVVGNIYDNPELMKREETYERFSSV